MKGSERVARTSVYAHCAQAKWAARRLRCAAPVRPAARQRSHGTLLSVAMTCPSALMQTSLSARAIASWPCSPPRNISPASRTPSPTRAACADPPAPAAATSSATVASGVNAPGNGRISSSSAASIAAVVSPTELSPATAASSSGSVYSSSSASPPTASPSASVSVSTPSSGSAMALPPVPSVSSAALATMLRSSCATN